jgi:hypothetical protein
MGKIKELRLEVIESIDTPELVDILLDRFSTLRDVNTVSSEKMVHLMNVIEAEHVNRLAGVYEHADDMGV